MATVQETTHTVVRTTRFIPKPYSHLLSRLEASIKQNPQGGFAILTPQARASKETFTAATQAQLGPHEFMHFLTIDHGAWTPLFGTHTGKQAVRIIFGNPLIAITMIRHDVNAGLFVPVEALVVEREDGKGVDVVQIKPSSLVAWEGERGSSELKEAAEALDAKVEALWEWVAGDEALPEKGGEI